MFKQAGYLFGADFLGKDYLTKNPVGFIRYNLFVCNIQCNTLFANISNKYICNVISITIIYYNTCKIIQYWSIPSIKSVQKSAQHKIQEIQSRLNVRLRPREAFAHP